MSPLSGYCHPAYAESLAEFGTPIRLEASGASVLQRSIPGSDFVDALGTYPLLCAQDWSALATDLETLGRSCVSMTGVSDPFAPVSVEQLREYFPHVALPYKRHFVVEFPASASSFVDSHHRYYARWSLKRVRVQVLDDPRDLLEDWQRLYQALIARHEVAGLRAFSPRAFERQFSIPGLTALRATTAGKTVAAQLWYTIGSRAYSHLTCCDGEGYRARASYALYWSALEHFQHRVNFLDLGAAAGNGNDTGGLETFKKGWANAHRDVYLVGRIFNDDAYQRLVRDRSIGPTSYFPAYRKGEFA